MNPELTLRPPSQRVLIIQRRLTHYRVPLFDRMRAQLAAAGVQLDVVYGDPTPAERSKRDEGTLPWGRYVPCRYWLDGRLCWQHPGAALRDADLVIVTQENKMLLNHLLMLRRDFRLAYWGHGANLQSERPRGPLERFKRWTAGKVDWWFAYTQLSRELVQASGFPPQRITVLNNAIDVTSLRRQCESLQPQELTAMRKDLGLHDGPVGIFVGSLYADKRLDFLLDAAQAIRARVPGFQLLVLGDGPQRDLVHSCSMVHPWIRWAGVRMGREKAVCLALANVMLNPGLVGLGILDSFAAGLPMLTTDRRQHSPEIAYLEHGVNGLMTADNLDAYVQATVDLLGDEALLKRLRVGCRTSAGEYTLEHMAKHFCEGILQCLNTPDQRPGAAP
jgi:glycosyltransferase involved in cell wall biosynthesis